MHTESRPDTPPSTQHHPGMTLSDISWQIKDLDFSTINKFLIKALCHGLPPPETIYDGIGTGKAAKCQEILVLTVFQIKCCRKKGVKECERKQQHLGKRNM